MAKILVVNSDSSLSADLAHCLRKARHEIEMVAEVEEAKSRLRFYTYDLVIIGARSGERLGIEFCRYLGKEGVPMPLLIVSDDPRTTPAALQAGADECISWPVRPREIRARIEALLRRPYVDSAVNLTFRHISMDRASRQVLKEGIPVQLTRAELVLLELLLCNPGKVIALHVIKTALRDLTADLSDTAVRVCVARLRKKIDLAGQPPLIRTVARGGYTLDSGSGPGPSAPLHTSCDRPIGKDSRRVLVLSANQQLRHAVMEAAATHQISTELLEESREHCDVAASAADAAVVVIDAAELNAVTISAMIRSRNISAPILVLTACDEVMRRSIFVEAALSAGADAVVGTRFDAEVLSLWLEALMRRPRTYCGERLQRGDLTLDTRKRTLSANDLAVSLPPSEAAVLALFMRHPQRLFTPNEIVDKLYSNATDVSPLAVRISISRLRRRMEACRVSTKIGTVHGIGYRLECA